MQILEDRVPVRPDSLSIEIDRGLGFARRRLRPGRQQRRGQIGDRPAHRLGQLRRAAGYCFCLSARTPSTSRAMRSFLSTWSDAFGELGRFVDLAIGQDREEGSIEDFAVARIAAQRRAIIGRGRRRVAFDAGMPGGQKAAGRRGAREVRGRPAPARTARPVKPIATAAAAARAACRNEAKGSLLVNSIWRTNAFGVAALTGREWPVWACPAITAPAKPVH